MSASEVVAEAVGDTPGSPAEDGGAAATTTEDKAKATLPDFEPPAGTCCVFCEPALWRAD